MSQIRFVDTTIRLGQLSLWALGMRTRDMLAITDIFGGWGRYALCAMQLFYSSGRMFFSTRI